MIKKRRGISLVEILVALFIFFIAAAALYDFFGKIAVIISEYSNRVRALGLTASQIDDIYLTACHDNTLVTDASSAHAATISYIPSGFNVTYTSQYVPAGYYRIIVTCTYPPSDNSLTITGYYNEYFLTYYN